MEIDVKGNGNRVAGRDYYENRSKPCPKCEQRFITSSMSICNNCRSHEAMMAARTKLIGFVMGVFVVFGWLMQRRINAGITAAPEDLAGMLVTSVGIVLIAVALYVLVTEWFKRNW